MKYFPTQLFFNQSLISIPFGLWLFPLLSWSLIWKGIALWKTGRNNQLNWFIALLIFNTAGLLPILYLLFFQPITSPSTSKKKSSSKRK
ncbi:MAG: DUF5652 family protein [Patescibacteria group bacterium]|nr:DUF5652 family protein [Patescibacteria group bacterium]